MLRSSLTSSIVRGHIQVRGWERKREREREATRGGAPVMDIECGGSVPRHTRRRAVIRHLTVAVVDVGTDDDLGEGRGKEKERRDIWLEFGRCLRYCNHRTNSRSPQPTYHSTSHTHTHTRTHTQAHTNTHAHTHTRTRTLGGSF